LSEEKEDEKMPDANAPKFKPGYAVKYQGKLWKVSQIASGPLPARYLLDPTTSEGAVVAREDEIEAWKNE
jgi:hypothetical protein